MATNNAGKLGEFRALLAGCGWELLAPADLRLRLDVDESGTTYRKNAELKARAFADVTGLYALADDSGLEVDALNGAPGVHSARFGGAGLTDAQRVTLLLQALEGTPVGRRSARFRCVLVLVAPEGRHWITEGVREGSLTESPRGDTGFGYDPIFHLPALGQTMAELPAELKNELSHRALAMRDMRPILTELLHGESVHGPADGLSGDGRTAR